ncbi:transcription initiation protein SPT3 homolog [Lingula anatina]|uniref:Transcription initiation protein SPT3 homolog n=1 Tax=Lingula anatina TaxID=7574 RepID=A0A2R2ML07_LINAN|nr:transcription initiation protein SPT3 homolog [Lingula anatina]|eukprot:XP_023930906.1 transcription initiation protein SPT3 homolog [Lingula anatina]
MEHAGMESPPARVRKHDSPHQGTLSKSHEAWFATEIQQMMHGFGDCRKPLLQSAELIESIVHEQMVALLVQASEVNAMRNGRYLGLEDLLFIMRKSKSKLRRLIRYLELKDLKAAALKGTSIDEDENGEQELKAARKRRKVCYDFLSTIDQTGELLALFDDESPDEVKVERALRAELQTRHMDPNQYMQYCEARQVSFSQKYKSQKFKDWLLSGVPGNLKPNPLALEALAYLAYECIAQIVDLALLVKRDKQAEVDNPFNQLMPSSVLNYDPTPLMLQLHSAALALKSPPSTGPVSPSATPPSTPSTPSNPLGLSGSTIGTVGTPGSGGSSTVSNIQTKSRSKKRNKSGSSPSVVDVSSQAIQPADIREALRRYGQAIGVFNTFSKNRHPSPRDVLLCC